MHVHVHVLDACTCPVLLCVPLTLRFASRQDHLHVYCRHSVRRLSLEQETFASENGLKLPPPGLTHLWVPVHMGRPGTNRTERRALVHVDVFFGKHSNPGNPPFGRYTPHVGHAWAPHHSAVGCMLPGKSMRRYEYPIL